MLFKLQHFFPFLFFFFTLRDDLNGEFVLYVFPSWMRTMPYSVSLLVNNEKKTKVRTSTLNKERTQENRSEDKKCGER